MSAIQKPIANSLTPKAISYLNSRGISEQTAKSVNLYSTNRYIQKVGGEGSQVGVVKVPGTHQYQNIICIGFGCQFLK